MKCATIIISFLALGYAWPTFRGDKQVSLDQEDNTITIDGSLGKKVVISRVPESPGQRNVEIYMEDRTGPTKKIWFKDQTNQDQAKLEFQDEPTEADILVQIFEVHQGTIDDDTFEDILRKVGHFVQTGHVDKTVLDILRSFDHQDQDTLHADQSPEVRSLKKLLQLLRTSGYHHKNIDVDRIIKENAVFINEPAGQNIDQDDLDLQTQRLKRLLQEDHAAWPHVHNSLGDLSRKHKHGLLEIGQESPLFRRHDQRQESWITREQLFDRNLKELSRGQSTKSAGSKFNDGIDQDDDLQHLFMEGKRIILGKGFIPETADGEIDTRAWSRDQIQTLQNPWQHHYFKHFVTPNQLLINQRRLANSVGF